MECIFCKIISGTIPAKKIYETESSLAFLDAFPLTKGHTLVIPKKHYIKIQEMKPEENLDLFDSVRIIIQKAERIKPSSLIAVHNGRESGQEVPHVHVHIIPRDFSDGAGPVHSMFANRPNLSGKELDDIAKVLRR